MKIQPQQKPLLLSGESSRNTQSETPMGKQNSIVVAFLVASLAFCHLASPSFIFGGLQVAEAEETPRKKVCKESFCFQPQWVTPSGDVPLLGIARFKYLLFPVYLAGLYANSSEIKEKGLLGEIPKRLDLVYLRDMKGSTLIKASEEYFKDHYPSFKEEFGSELAEINTFYHGVKKGESYSLHYLPGKGLSLYFNGQLKGTIKGDKFSNAYLRIWLAENSRASSLLPILTGQKS